MSVTLKSLHAKSTYDTIIHVLSQWTDSFASLFTDTSLADIHFNNTFCLHQANTGIVLNLTFLANGNSDILRDFCTDLFVPADLLMHFLLQDAMYNNRVLRLPALIVLLTRRFDPPGNSGLLRVYVQAFVHLEAMVVEREQHGRKRKVKEALHIHRMTRKDGSMNQDRGLHLSKIWLDLVQ